MSHFDHFDLLAPVYERYIKPVDPTHLLNLVGLPVSGLLLDAGGGTGRISYLLKGWVGGVVIADSSIGMLKQAKTKAGLTIICSHTEHLPFRDETFERVIMVDALHHVSDYRTTIDDLWRVTKTGGRIVIGEPDIDRIPVKIIAVIEKLAMMRSHFISPLNIQKAFGNKKYTVGIIKQGTTSWIIVDKQRGAEMPSVD